MYLGKDIDVPDNVSAAISNIRHQKFEKLPLGSVCSSFLVQKVIPPQLSDLSGLARKSGQD
jgi:hypothetical protein